MTHLIMLLGLPGLVIGTAAAQAEAAGLHPAMGESEKAAIHPVGDITSLRAWLSRVPHTREFPPDFAATLRGEAPAFVIEMTTTQGCVPCADLWYGYRASKAALNMIVKSAAIEIARSRKQALCVALHPGTVDTPLSEPFQRGVPTGTLFARERAAAQLLSVLENLKSEQSGRIFAWDGSEIVP